MSVKDNIRFGRPDATDEEVIEAARAVGAHEFIMRLPGGYDYVIQEIVVKHLNRPKATDQFRKNTLDES